ncbi:VOC family protein [Streptomyces sp. NBC_00878]|uniref:VOC family protein n=1 Tax=Streptomyces sp. NBC_00878 TaxID=2975854 RepID=UPI0022576261|nr:VOC family protein [Streptomyces sp. NBC_00878]MCX4904662.1 VOC family protein [Streptomyces sp. NBC_00878]
MALHRLSSIVMGVPDPARTISYYTEFGLSAEPDGWLSTRDGGRQLRVVPAPTRRLLEVSIGVDSPDDLASVLVRLDRLGIPADLDSDALIAYEQTTRVRAVLRVEPRITQTLAPPTPYNGPGRTERTTSRAPGIVRSSPVRPRKLGHAVLGTTNFAATTSFFADGLGFKVSDLMGEVGAFLRCSTDHHNLLVLAAPVVFLHHTSWQVDDIDDVGRGAAAMLENHPERHVWGLGRHHAGSNFFWYLKDPAGNFCEYYSDMDCILDDQLWKPEVFDGAKGLFNWGPPPPPSFIKPDDLADLMTGSHSN